MPSDGSSSTAPGQASFGSDVAVDLAVYFQGGVSDDDITDFILEVLSKPAEPDRQGQAHVDGVQYTSGDYTRDAVYVTFFPNATEDERQAVIDAVQASPMVERIALDVIPTDTPVD